MSTSNEMWCCGVGDTADPVVAKGSLVAGGCGFFVHTMKHCYAMKQASSVTLY